MVMDDIRRMIETAIPFVERSGLKVLELSPGYVKLRMPFDGNQNHVGTMYAGALFTLAEIPGGALCYGTFDPQKYFPLAKEMTIRYRKPVRTDAFIEVGLSQNEIQRIQRDLDTHGKADFTVHADVRDAEGDAVASISGLYQIRAVTL
ncbi:PaaI family thioesterase [Desulfosoma caldarium]|uniref:Thioesterase domain-containing protein n=1 Tax=Desulfosoma caldarium TaxID=610254 RepID=A0A3N1UKL0_9BACT|nr:YiiD C-terminal domain-containing protein [Desulfosoma caldarium]ROQ89919.1 thioesterase domain-containing protein [Desulfosoma caldarium]